MRMVRRLWSRGKGKLAVWLAIWIFAVNLLVLLVCFIFQYDSVNHILLKKDSEDNIKRFEQSKYNISIFCEEIDTISKNISIDVNLQKLANSSKTMSDSEAYYYANQVLGSFITMQEYYSYIKSICYYGDDGVVVKRLKGASNSNVFRRGGEKDDWFYSSGIVQSDMGSQQKLKWYGGFRNLDFGRIYQEEEPGRYYISGARTIQNGAGVLVVNVDMDYFLDLFYASNGSADGEIYVIDEHNRIVAARDTGTIGTKRQFSEREQLYEGIDRYQEKAPEGERQIIVYALSDQGWSLVSETPVAEVTRDSVYLRNILLFSCLLSVAVSFAASMWWVSRMLKPMNRLAAGMQRLQEGQLGVTVDSVPNNEIGAVARHFNQMSGELKELFEQKERAEQEKRKLEMRSLRAQINPHLIYNTLNNIKWMAIINQEKNIAESISLLSAFLRPVFQNQEPVCTIREEIEYVKNYIAIMNLRGTEGYTLNLDVPEEYYGYPIIRFLLQPVVENAILHGLAEKESGTIRISMQLQGGDGLIQVEDDGGGIHEEQLARIRQKLDGRENGEEKGVGIANVNRRMKVEYGEGYGLAIGNRSGGGTVVTLRIRLGKEDRQL